MINYSYKYFNIKIILKKYNLLSNLSLINFSSSHFLTTMSIYSLK